MVQPSNRSALIMSKHKFNPCLTIPELEFIAKYANTDMTFLASTVEILGDLPGTQHGSLWKTIAPCLVSKNSLFIKQLNLAPLEKTSSNIEHDLVLADPESDQAGWFPVMNQPIADGEASSQIQSGGKSHGWWTELQ